MTFLVISILTGVLKKWRLYYPTVLYLSFCNLLYFFLCDKYPTWSYKATFLHTRKNVELLNTLIMLPCTAVLYLHFIPKETKKKITYYFIWVIGFSCLEFHLVVFSSDNLRSWMEYIVFDLLLFCDVLYARTSSQKCSKSINFFSDRSCHIDYSF
ncbi:CBO0543 family protein [Paenibacillus hexagrammi]|uniref:CBO0543 family protein n=1 Tax=Paenibacillus hexagrammi TaxID=2908839 RepID=UPI003312FB14